MLDARCVAKLPYKDHYDAAARTGANEAVAVRPLRRMTKSNQQKCITRKILTPYKLVSCPVDEASRPFD